MNKTTINKSTYFRKKIILLAGAGFAVYLLYLLFFTDFTQVGAVIGKTDMIIFALAFPFVLVASAFDALAWLFTLDNLSVRSTFNRIFSLSWVGHFVDTLIPGGLAGDAFKTYLLTKDKDVNGAKAVASIVIKDVIELLVVLGSLIVGLVLLVSNYSVNTVVVLVIGLVIVLIALPLVLILYLSFNVSALEKILRIVNRAIGKIQRKESSTITLSEKFQKQITEFHDGVMSIKNKPGQMLIPVIFQTLAWIFELLTFFVVFIATGSYIGIDKIVIANTIISNIQGQGVALAGISQVVASELYKVLGITAGMAVASSLLAGFVSFWFKLVLSFVFFQITVFKRHSSMNVEKSLAN